MAAPSSDNLLLGAALLFAVGSAVGFGVRGWQKLAPAAPLPPAELAGAPYEPKASDAPPSRSDAWTAPVAQSRGREWLYDAFTPPEIFYNARTRQFTVKPPSSLLDDEAQEPFGLELVAVRPEPFRLQLIGYVGGEGHWRGTFQNVVTGEVFLGSAGRNVPNLGVMVVNLDVSPQPVRVRDSMTTRQRVATALVRDEKSGRDVTLTHRERHFTGTVFAFVSAPGETATREVRTGDVFKLGDTTYRIEDIKISPAAVDIVKESPTLGQPDRRTLVPRETDTLETAEPEAEHPGS
jgi:hypothetical protein